jgi:hypothetical protein
MIGAVDSLGNSYLKLSQAVSNTCTTLIALAELIDVLDHEDANWKLKSVLILDGASFHKVDDVVNFLSLMGVKHMILSPHSPTV